MASIIQINGKWRATVRKKEDGKVLINRSKTFDSKRAALDWAALVESEVILKGVDHVAGALWAAAGWVDTGLSFLSFLELYRTDIPQC